MPLSSRRSLNARVLTEALDEATDVFGIDANSEKKLIALGGLAFHDFAMLMKPGECSAFARRQFDLDRYSVYGQTRIERGAKLVEPLASYRRDWQRPRWRMFVALCSARAIAALQQFAVGFGPDQWMNPLRIAWAWRKQIDDEALQGLAASIAEHGVLQPVLVTETLDGYELIAGERRLRAARMAGLERIPAIVRQLAGREQLEVALVENIQRADLNALEEAEAYLQLINDFGMSQDDVARRVGRARSTIANSVRLLDLAPVVQAALRDGSVSEGHARAIASLETPAAQETLLAAVKSRGLSVRQTEELARRLKLVSEQGSAETAQVSTSRASADPEVERIEAELQAALATKVSVTRSRKGGRIVIEYYDDADLSRLYERLVGGIA